MENILKNLFEYQRFENNEKLANIINDVEKNYMVTSLGDDELELVNAAGDTTRRDAIKDLDGKI